MRKTLLPRKFRYPKHEILHEVLDQDGSLLKISKKALWSRDKKVQLVTSAGTLYTTVYWPQDRIIRVESEKIAACCKNRIVINEWLETRCRDCRQEFSALGDNYLLYEPFVDSEKQNQKLSGRVSKEWSEACAAWFPDVDALELILIEANFKRELLTFVKDWESVVL